MEEVLNDGNLSNDNSSEDFFGQLEADVNSGIIDEIDQSEQVTPEANMAPEPQATQVQHQGSNDNDWEKRYKDSSREAQRLNSELNELKPYVPVLEAMKNDSGLVDHVRGYFEEGGAPSGTITDRLGLDEDFVYDQQEAVTDPTSDSAKVFNAHVEQTVQHRLQETIAREKQAQMNNQQEIEKRREEQDFKARYNMSDEAYSDFVEKAKGHTLTLEDAYHVVNRNEASSQIAQNTRKDMLGQMKNVRDIPTSVSNANSTQVEKSSSDSIFDALNTSDGNLDDLFG
jgi:hypothetical protein